MQNRVQVVMLQKQLKNPIHACSLSFQFKFHEFTWCQFVKKVTVNNTNNQNTTGFIKIVKTKFFILLSANLMPLIMSLIAASKMKGM